MNHRNRFQFNIKRLLLATGLIAALCGGLLWWNEASKTKIVFGLFDSNTNRILEVKKYAIQEFPDEAFWFSSEFTQFVNESIYWQILNDQTIAAENDRLSAKRYFAIELNEKYRNQVYELVPIHENSLKFLTRSDGSQYAPDPGDQVDIVGLLESEGDTTSWLWLCKNSHVFSVPELFNDWEFYVVALTSREAVDYRVSRGELKSVNFVPAGADLAEIQATSLKPKH